jgi:hypothetical protein
MNKTKPDHHESLPIAARAKEFLTLHWAKCILGGIVLLASILSLYWVFTVPLLQNPDETSHVDYVFSLYSAGRLLNVRRPPSAWNVHAQFEGRADVEGPERTPYDFISHQYTLYLIDSTEFQRIRFHENQKVPSDYGTRAYFQKLDAGAPQTPANIADLRTSDNPWMVSAYPFGYYVTAAIWIKILSVFDNGPATLFLGVRILSVILLMGSLCLTYANLRELQLRKTRALCLTAIVGFFPLTPFISSSVQPDNLTLFLVLLCFYLGFRLRRETSNKRRFVVLLGLALGALLVTKYHLFLFTAASILAMLVSEHIFRRESWAALLRKMVWLVWPSAVLFALQLWIVKGGPITGGNLHRAAGFLGGVKSAILDYYRGGPALVSWWGRFGWMDAPLTIRSSGIELRVLSLISAGTLLILLLLFFRFEKVLTRLVVLVARRRWRMALRISFSNPLLTSHIMFSVFMIFLYAFTDNSFFAQGRHWFPYIVSGFLITTQYAPQALTHRKTQAALSALLVAGLMLYCLIAGYYSIAAIKYRYYSPQTRVSIGRTDSVLPYSLRQARRGESANG